MFYAFISFTYLINRNVISLIIAKRKLIFRREKKNRCFAFHVIRMWSKYILFVFDVMLRSFLPLKCLPLRAMEYKE